MEFHEIAGLAVLGAFVLHILLNWRWVLQVTAHFFQKRVTMRTRVGWLLNASLLVCFVLIGLSGAFMSRVVFHFSVPGNWETLHYFCSALVIILVGIHLGLHLGMMGNLISSRVRTSAAMKKVILCCLAVLVAAVGIYSIPTTSFSMWITMPFSVQGGPPAGERPDFEEGKAPERSSDESQTPPAESLDPELLDENSEGEEQERPEKPDGERGHGGPQESASAGNIIWKAVQYLSIFALFAVVTRAVEIVLKGLFKNRAARKRVS